VEFLLQKAKAESAANINQIQRQMEFDYNQLKTDYDQSQRALVENTEHLLRLQQIAQTLESEKQATGINLVDNQSALDHAHESINKLQFHAQNLEWLLHPADRIFSP
jgi:hypothetical protein